MNAKACNKKNKCMKVLKTEMKKWCRYMTPSRPKNALGRDFFADSQMLAITHHQDCGLLFVKISPERESGPLLQLGN